MNTIKSTPLRDFGVPDFIKDNLHLNPLTIIDFLNPHEFVNHLVLSDKFICRANESSTRNQYVRINTTELKVFLGVNILIDIKRSPICKLRQT